MTCTAEFFTTTYEREHGKKPSGRGGWAFIVMDGARAVETVFSPGGLTLAAAKTWMRTYCRTTYADVPAGAVEIEIAP